MERWSRTELLLEENSGMLHKLKGQRLGRPMRKIAWRSHGLIVMRCHLSRPRLFGRVLNLIDKRLGK